MCNMLRFVVHWTQECLRHGACKVHITRAAADLLLLFTPARFAESSTPLQTGQRRRIADLQLLNHERCENPSATFLVSPCAWQAERCCQCSQLDQCLLQSSRQTLQSCQDSIASFVVLTVTASLAGVPAILGITAAAVYGSSKRIINAQQHGAQHHYSHCMLTSSLLCNVCRQLEVSTAEATAGPAAVAWQRPLSSASSHSVCKAQ